MGGYEGPGVFVPPPQRVDPMEQVGKLMQMKSMLGGQQLQQEQLRGTQIQNQEHAMDLKDQQNMRSLAPQFIKRDDSGKPSGFDADGYYGALMGAGVSPQKIAAMQKAQNDAVLSRAQAGSAALDLDDKKNDQAYQVLEGVRSAAKDPKADPAGVQTAYQSGIARLQHLGIDTSKYPPQYPGDDGVTQFEVGLGVHKQVLADAKTQAESAKDTAQAREATAGATQKEAQTQAYKDAGLVPGAPVEEQSLMSYMRTVPGARPQNYPAWKAQQEAIATAPQKIAVAEAEGAARATREAQIARGSNAELAQVPPHLVSQATAAADKADQDYAQSKSVSDRLSAMMDAAKRGNVVSYQLIPQEGALQITTSQGVKRINMAEIQNYGGGSLWQRMQGRFGKALSGESIPAGVLDDMSEMQKFMTEGSRAKYENTLKSINQRTGATFKPVEMETMTSPATAPTKTYQGRTYEQQSDGSWKRQD